MLELNAFQGSDLPVRQKKKVDQMRLSALTLEGRSDLAPDRVSTCMINKHTQKA
jgi:hypothetical protein